MPNDLPRSADAVPRSAHALPRSAHALPHVLKRHALRLTLLAIGVLLSTQAFALPTFYAGLGARSYQLPGHADTTYAGSVEAGVDSIWNDMGLGLRADFPHLRPSVAAQARWTALNVWLARLYLGAGVGVENATKPTGAPSYSWSGVWEVFGGVRVSLPIGPYLAVQAGGAYSKVKDGFDPFATFAIGFKI